jgi:hypothetical protein
MSGVVGLLIWKVHNTRHLGIAGWLGLMSRNSANRRWCVCMCVCVCDASFLIHLFWHKKFRELRKELFRDQKRRKVFLKSVKSFTKKLRAEERKVSFLRHMLPSYLM